MAISIAGVGSGNGPSFGATYHVTEGHRTIYRGIDRESAIELYRRQGGADQAMIDEAIRTAEELHRRLR